MERQIPAEQMEQYRHTARLRWQAAQTRQEARRQQVWQLANQAAALLKAAYQVERVDVFGSLTQTGRFTSESDVDLAAWGLTSANWLRAMAAVRNLSDEIELNLVDIACCSPELLAAIEHEGIPL